jgi:heme A synthase
MKRVGELPNKLAKFNLVFVVFVILWGAWVRLSGSGAGCGEHWPLCNGQALPLDQGLKTLTELTHRLTSGLFGITILGMTVLGWKKFPKGHPSRFWLMASLVLTIVEALIGAVLVKKGLVDKNDSAMRAIVIGLHLINTLFLVGTIVMSEYLTRSYDFVKEKMSARDNKISYAICSLFLLAGSTGAITALGNTLFPETSLIEGMKKDFLDTSHFLIKLRIYHPIVAVTLVLSLVHFSLKNMDVERVKKTAKWVLVFSIIALSFGVVNWLLMAPTWGALVHLTLADILWILFVYLIGQKVYQNTETNQHLA